MPRAPLPGDVALPVGLLPALVAALTVGVAFPATIVAHVLARRGRPFDAALRTALGGVAGLFLLGVVVVATVAGPGARVPVAVALLAAGAGAGVVLVTLPLAVGRTVLVRARGLDPETALRFATYGWPVAALAVLVGFLAPGGLARGHLLHVGGDTVCFVGFCGVSLVLLAAALLELAVAVLGPGVVGLVLHASTTPGDGRRARTRE
jgi:hypothetical protein